MTFYETAMLYFSFIVSALLLIAGGWIKIRDYFRTKAAAKLEEAAQAAEVAAKAKADEIEAAVQERLKKLQADVTSTDQTATTVAGATATGSGATA